MAHEKQVDKNNKMCYNIAQFHIIKLPNNILQVKLAFKIIQGGKKMNNTTLTFSWIDKGLQHKRVYDREKIKAIFQGLKEGFEDDNEISTKLVNKLPETVVVFINEILILPAPTM